MSVDAALQVKVHAVTGTEEFFARSEWNEPDGVTQVDLYLGEVDGQWHWVR